MSTTNENLPADGEWPCQTEPSGQEPPRLVGLLYLLLRDRIAPGDMEQALLQVQGQQTLTTFTNPHLAELASAHAAFLTACDVAGIEYPFSDGDVLVLGPELFISESANVISYKGENYHPALGVQHSHTQAQKKLMAVQAILAKGSPDSGTPAYMAEALTQIAAVMHDDL